ncbi:phosphotransferase [Nocardiopsis sp. ARC36]
MPPPRSPSPRPQPRRRAGPDPGPASPALPAHSAVRSHRGRPSPATGATHDRTHAQLHQRHPKEWRRRGQTPPRPRRRAAPGHRGPRPARRCRFGARSRAPGPAPGADGRGSEGLGERSRPCAPPSSRPSTPRTCGRAGAPSRSWPPAGGVLVHALDPALLPGPGPLPGQVFVHGDFGPNNVLMEPCGGRVAAVLDWEWAHPGAPVEDLAWCEWVVRTYHPGEVGALEAFFAAYGVRPAWAERHAWMVRRCEEVAAFWEEWRPLSPTTGVRRAQSAATRAWRG